MPAPPSTAAAAPVDVILRDGSTLRLRAPARGDAGALIAFFERLSEHSRYLRFHGVRRVDATLVEHFLDPDWTDRGALIGALTDAEGNERVVALAEYARLRDPMPAEVAFTVADELQGRGAGHGCSSSSRSGPLKSESSSSSPRCSPRTPRCSRSSATRASRSRARSAAARSRCASRSRRRSAFAPAWRSATTSRSPRRCDRSSRRPAWP